MPALGLTDSLRLLFREAVHSPWVCMTALAGDDATPVIVPPDGPSRDPVLVLGGFLSHPAYYASLGRALARRGHPVHFDEGVNAIPFRDHVKRLVVLAGEITARSDRPLRIVGHSLGGLHALAVLVRGPEVVAQVIAVASPIVGGTPWTPLQRLVERVLEVRGEDTELLRARLAPFASRVATISSPDDLVAPPGRCALDGASNIVLTTVPRGDQHLASHSGVIFMRTAVRVILAQLMRPVTLPESVRRVG